MSYIDVAEDGGLTALSTDAAALATRTKQDMAARFENWTPREGQLDVAMIEVISRAIAENRDVASRVPAGIFRWFGRSVLGVPAVDAAYATVQTTWTVSDTAGHSVPANTLVGYPLATNTYAFFQTTEPVDVPPGQTQVTGVVLRSLNPGAVYNGLSPTALQLSDALTFVTGITSTSTSTGGADREQDAAYLDRLRARLQLLTPRPIRPSDFATLALDVPGVARAYAVDLYSPVNGRYDNERTVSVAVVDSSGNPVSDDVKEQVAALLEAQREVNFNVYAIDPNTTTVDVTATLVAYPDYEIEDVRTRAAAAIRAYLDPAKWDWDVVVRKFELVSLLDQVPGVRYVDALTTPADNIFLPGVASLARAGTVNISVNQG